MKWVVPPTRKSAFLDVLRSPLPQKARHLDAWRHRRQARLEPKG